jgi:N-methylhydantoinase A/oxoprolinase/acetone carboxylase beta subunit
MEVAVHDRQDLVTGRIYKGPAVVTEYSATTVVPETKKFRIDQAGNLIIVTR